MIILKRFRTVIFSLWITVFSAAAGAQTFQFTLPVDLSGTGQSAALPRVAVSSDGKMATAVWVRSNGTNQLIQSASGVISGDSVSWGSVTDLSAPGQHALNPQIALSADGTRATAVWHRSNGTNNIVQAMSATISGNTATWGTSANASATGQNATNAHVALSSDGTMATAVWQRSNGTNDIIQARSATISGNTITWGTVNNLSATGRDALRSKVALSGDGTRATVVWQRSNGLNVIIQSASATISGNTGSWSTVNNLSATGQSASNSDIGLSNDGTKATAVWQRSDGTNIIVQSSSATVSGNTASWSAPGNLSQDGRDASLSQIALSEDGTLATAVWQRSDGTNTIIQSASAEISGNTASWETAASLSEAGQDAIVPQVALSNDGTRAIATWQRSNGTDTIIQSASADINGSTATWKTPADLSKTGQSATNSHVSLSDDGTLATVVWQRSDGTDMIIQTSSGTTGPSAGTPTPTNTPDVNFTPTPTVLPTSAPTSGPTAVPTNVGTGSPTPPPVDITGRITADGQPVSGALVYILDVGAAITDNNGVFSISGAAAGISYRLFVQKSGVNFPEEGFAVNPEDNIQVAGVKVSFNPRGCTENDISNSLFQGTGRAAGIRSLGVNAAGSLGRNRRRAAERRLLEQLNSYINFSRKVPDIVLDCKGIGGCTAKTLRKNISGMKKRLNKIRRLALSVNRTLLDRGKRTERAARSFRREVARNNRAAKAIIRGLPRKSDACG